MFNKKDPLIGSVQKIMKENQIRRAAQQAVNDAFGITSAKALPHERVQDYNNALQETTEKMLSEGVEELDEISRKTLKSYVKKASQELPKLINRQDDAHKLGDRKTVAKNSRKKNNRLKGIATASNKMTSMTNKIRGIREDEIDEEQLDELSKEVSSIESIKEEIKAHLSRRLNEAEELGEEAVKTFLESLSQEEADILGFFTEASFRDKFRETTGLNNRAPSYSERRAQMIKDREAAAAKSKPDTSGLTVQATVRPGSGTPTRAQASTTGSSTKTYTRNLQGVKDRIADKTGVKPAKPLVSRGSSYQAPKLPDSNMSGKMPSKPSTAYKAGEAERKPTAGGATTSQGVTVKPLPKTSDAVPLPKQKPKTTPLPKPKPKLTVKASSPATRSISRPSSGGTSSRPASTGGSSGGQPSWATKAFNPDLGYTEPVRSPSRPARRSTTRPSSGGSSGGQPSWATKVFNPDGGG